MTTETDKSYRYKLVQKRVKKIKGFYVHLLVYLFINIAIFIMSSRDDGILEALTEIGNYSTAFFWGIGLLAHWCDVFMPNIFFGKEWEEKKIREIMEKQKQKNWE